MRCLIALAAVAAILFSPSARAFERLAKPESGSLLTRVNGHCGRGCGHHHHHGNGFTDMADFVGRQQRVAAGEDPASASRGQFHVVARRRHRAVLDRAKSVAPAVFAGEHAEHPRHGACRLDVDRNKARVRVGRTHEPGKDLTLEREVVAEAALAGDEPQVFLAAHRLADGLEMLGLIRFEFHY